MRSGNIVAREWCVVVQQRMVSVPVRPLVRGQKMVVGYRILIVDDDPDFVQAMRAVLRAKGYRVDSAHDGDEALASIRQEKPDLVLLDIIMSWPLEGTSVSRTLMSKVEWRDIPIIVCTSIRNSEYRGFFPQDEYLHIDSWLDKPVSPDTLIEEIERILDRHGRFRKAS
jgi:CheY-like chemotaxis protein